MMRPATLFAAGADPMTATPTIAAQDRGLHINARCEALGAYPVLDWLALTAIIFLTFGGYAYAQGLRSGGAILISTIVCWSSGETPVSSIIKIDRLRHLRPPSDVFIADNVLISNPSHVDAANFPVSYCRGVVKRNVLVLKPMYGADWKGERLIRWWPLCQFPRIAVVARFLVIVGRAHSCSLGRRAPSVCNSPGRAVSRSNIWGRRPFADSNSEREIGPEFTNRVSLSEGYGIARRIGGNSGSFISAKQESNLNGGNDYQSSRESFKPQRVISDPFFRRPTVNVGLGMLAGALWCAFCWIVWGRE